jgi:acyl-CoA synthetase (NDP forming)
VDSADIPHKSDIGGVKVGIRSDDEVGRAFEEILGNARARCPGAAVGGVLVQEMARPGTEVIVGVAVDPQFGPAVLCGMGGVFVEVFKDTALCLAPLTKGEALDMIRSLKSVKLMEGYRGLPPLDLEALADLIVSVGSFACAHKDDLKEADLNPVFLYEKGLCAVDALVVKAERG